VQVVIELIGEQRSEPFRTIKDIKTLRRPECLARLHARIGDIRKDALHKLTTGLVDRFTVIGIEDLNVRGMMANDRLARSIADMGFHELRRQLEYKVVLHGSRIVVADRWHPSSKTCSACGVVMEALPLAVRE
jgi:putative transposase